MSTDNPANTLVSIIIPAYNVEPYLAECMESVCNQTHRNLQVLLVDDASTDGTPALADSYAKADERVTVIHQEANRGAAVARNLGIDRAEGEYLLFFDGDDVMLPQMVETLLARAIETDAQVTSCRSTTFQHETGEDLPNDNGPHLEDFDAVYSGAGIGKGLFKAFIGWPWDKLFSAAYIKSLDLRFQEISSSEDASFVYIALAHADRIALVPQKLARHRMRPASNEADSYQTPHNIARAYEAILERFTKDELGDDLLLACKNWGLSQTRWAFRHYAGNPQSQHEVLEDYLALLGGELSDDELFFGHEKRARETLRYASETSAEQAAMAQAFEASDLQAERDHLIKLVEAGNARVKAAETRIEHLEAVLEATYKEIGGLHARINELESSTTFRVGQAVTVMPRALKDAATRIKR